MFCLNTKKESIFLLSFTSVFPVYVVSELEAGPQKHLLLFIFPRGWQELQVGPRMLAATKRFWEWVMSVVIIYTCTPTIQPTNQPYRPRRLKGKRMRTQRGCTSCTYLREHVSEHYYFCDFYSDVVLHLLTASEWEKFVWSLVVE